MPKRKRDKKQAKRYSQMPCIVCGDTYQVSGDHIKSFGSGGKCTDDNMMPLCFKHHRQKEDIKLTRFVKEYPFLEDVLIQKGFWFSKFDNKWKKSEG